MTTENLTLLGFLNELRLAKIYYRLSQHRDDAIMVEASVPGERWEVEFLDGGDVEVEVFRTDGNILDAAALAAMVAKHSDATAEPVAEAVGL